MNKNLKAFFGLYKTLVKTCIQIALFHIASQEKKTVVSDY